MALLKSRFKYIYFADKKDRGVTLMEYSIM